MRLRPAFPMFFLAAVTCGITSAQQAVDPLDVNAAATGISRRAEQLKPVLEQVRPADWVEKGAPDAYVSQWKSIVRQNQAVASDMTAVAQRAEADSQQLTPQAPLAETLDALFRLHRFDADLAGLLGPVRRYQGIEIAEQIEAIAAGDQNGIEKLQQYALDLAHGKERQLEMMDKEAQRCRSTLAIQPVNRPATQKKTTSGTQK